MKLEDLIAPVGLTSALFGDKIYSGLIKDSSILELSSLGIALVLYGNAIYKELIKHSLEQSYRITKGIYSKVISF